MDGLVMRSWLMYKYPLRTHQFDRGKKVISQRVALNDEVVLEGRNGNKTTFFSSSSKLMYKYPLRTLQFDRRKKVISHRAASNDEVVLEGKSVNSDRFDSRNGNWVLKILEVGSLWNDVGKQGMSEEQNGNFTLGCEGRNGRKQGISEGQNGNFTLGCGRVGGDEECKESCSGGEDDDDEREVKIDRDTFRKMLKKVSSTEAKLFAKLCYLSRLAYAIPIIKPRNMLKRYGLKYITSSIEIRQQSVTTEQSQASSETDHKNHDKGHTQLTASAAIEIAASAASFLHNHTNSIATIRPLRDSQDGVDYNVKEFDGGSDMASLRATTDSVTAVVAAEEEVKQAIADDLNSQRYHRPGSETLASWQANLLFEPVQFEGLDVFVHRGIYEAAKGIYEKMLPEIDSFMKANGERAKFRFTGHSLGGSLSMLINLMLLIRGVVPYSSLLPVITFGSPCIMCGGDYLLHKLGLPKSHVQGIVMHRDIVPRIFACCYPKPAAELLKAVNGKFRNHPCLENQKQLYTPMGEILILQPDAKHSPQHQLLPSYTGLFLLSTSSFKADDAETQFRSAVLAFLNTPHPLEILSDHSAYGSDGAILRDHDISSYHKCLRSVISLELSLSRKARKKKRKAGWYLRLSRVMGRTKLGLDQAQFGFLGTGVRESLKRLTGLVKS